MRSVREHKPNSVRYSDLKKLLEKYKNQRGFLRRHNDTYQDDMGKMKALYDVIYSSSSVLVTEGDQLKVIEILLKRNSKSTSLSLNMLAKFEGEHYDEKLISFLHGLENKAAENIKPYMKIFWVLQRKKCPVAEIVKFLKGATATDIQELSSYNQLNSISSFSRGGDFVGISSALKERGFSNEVILQLISYIKPESLSEIPKSDLLRGFAERLIHAFVEEDIYKKEFIELLVKILASSNMPNLFYAVLLQHESIKGNEWVIKYLLKLDGMVETDLLNFLNSGQFDLGFVGLVGYLDAVSAADNVFVFMLRHHKGIESTGFFKGVEKPADLAPADAGFIHTMNKRIEDGSFRGERRKVKRHVQTSKASEVVAAPEASTSAATVVVRESELIKVADSEVYDPVSPVMSIKYDDSDSSVPSEGQVSERGSLSLPIQPQDGNAENKILNPALLLELSRSVKLRHLERKDNPNIKKPPAEDDLLGALSVALDARRISIRQLDYDRASDDDSGWSDDEVVDGTGDGNKAMNISGSKHVDQKYNFRTMGAQVNGGIFGASSSVKAAADTIKDDDSDSSSSYYTSSDDSDSVNSFS